MKGLSFKSGEELASVCRERGMTIADVMRAREAEESDRTADALNAEMQKDLEVMRASVGEGLTGELKSVSGLTGGDAALLMARAERVSLSGSETLRAVASSMAVVEVNASMGRIVAAPTAGASGILPGVLFECAERFGWSDGELVSGLFTAGAIGMLIAMNASLSGAEGGCQAETGSAAAMAAAALTELSGGTPEQALTAAAIAIKNILGLVCDPVAGLVECPCIKRNALGAANALVSADMALAGIKSIIPFDESVSAMRAVGRSISPDLRETARGGCAATATGKEIMRQMKLDGEE